MATSAPFDPIASALEAVAEHIQARFPGAVSIRGPEEFPEDYAGGLVFAVTDLGEPERQDIVPTLVERTDLSPSAADVLYKIAQLRQRAMLTMWSDYRFLQDLTAGVVEGSGAGLESLWHNRLPFKAGLELVSSGYHDRPLTIMAGGGRFEADPGGVTDGMWRRIWSLNILTDLVARDPDAPVAESLTFELTTELGQDMVTEPDLTVPAP